MNIIPLPETSECFGPRLEELCIFILHYEYVYCSIFSCYGNTCANITITCMFKLFNKKPIVSVIIASYNHENFVIEAINSVLNQTITDIEIIIIDDASTDSSAEKIAQLTDPRIRFIQQQNNREFPIRNIGISLARGKYIAFQNSDDVWTADKLEKQINAFKKNPSLSACFSEIEIIDEKGLNKNNTWAEGLFTKENRTSSEWLRYFFDIGNCLCISSSMIRKKDLLCIGGFRPKLTHSSDFDLWIQLAGIGEFFIVSELLTKMRIVSDKNLSAPSPKSDARFKMDYIDILHRYREPGILLKLPTIFNDIYTEKKEISETEKLGRLALYAWEKDTHHIIFANSIIGKMLDDSIQRNELIELFGTKIVLKHSEMQSVVKLTRL